MLEVDYESLVSTRRRTVRFDLGSDEANALEAVTVAWKINSRIVASRSINSTENPKANGVPLSAMCMACAGDGCEDCGGTGRVVVSADEFARRAAWEREQKAQAITEADRGL